MATSLSAGARLRRFRERLGISLREAARQLQVPHPVLRAWEEGRATPVPDNRYAVQVWTRSEIKADSWPLTDREREIAKNAALVRPATRPKTGTDS